MHMYIRTLAIVALTTLTPTAFAKTCAVAISGDDAMKYDKSEIAVAASCSKITVTLTHTGKMEAKVMGHDWVLAKTADFDGVTKDGMKAGMANDFLPPGDARVIAHTKLIGGGETTSVTFDTSKLTKGGDYTFFCSFPGHWGMMKGKFVFK